MIPTETDISKVDSLPGKETKFSIGDPRWVMRSMADLYSNRELAVCREYSTNAFDANKEAGVTDPIEVTLPSALDPHFRVRDFGTGMSTNTLEQIYTSFGDSTKRTSNDYNGMLGFGSKSAVAYTTSFTVSSVHNGVKTIAVVSRQPDWDIIMKTVSVARTDERNGTEVTVPVHNAAEFARKASDFYKFWLPGTVLVNGKCPEHHVGEKIADNFFHSNDYDASYVVMGNVPYKIENPRALFRNSSIGALNFVAYVPNGDVEFTPNREALKYSDKTKVALQEVIDHFEKAIVVKAKADIATATTHQEAFVAWHKWTQELGTSLFSTLEFKGERFVSNFNIYANNWRFGGWHNRVDSIRAYNVESMAKTMVVTEFHINMSSNVKTRSKEYAALKGWNLTNILFTSSKGSDIVSPWIPRDKFVTWEDLKAALPKKARQANASGPKRIAGTFDYYTKSDSFHEKPLPVTGEVMYITTAERDEYNIRTILREINCDAAVVILGRNRIDKFKRDNPKTQPFIPYAKSKVVIDAGTLLSDEAKEIMALDYGSRRWVVGLKNQPIDDPEVTRIASMISREDRLLKAYQENEALARSLKMWYDVKQYTAVQSKNWAKDYPLLQSLGSNYARTHGKDLALYINAAYAARKDN